MSAEEQIIQNQKTLPRLASFTSHLLLDGHGITSMVSHERRDMHPYFGKWPYNVGDQFVALTIARILNFTEFYSIAYSAPQKDFDIINGECDAFIIRGSNFIYPGFFAKFMNLELLRKIKIPIIYIGAGIQYALGEDIYLTKEDIESLKYIHGSSMSCSVRGVRAAELLQKAGIDNVRVTGCPTIVWSLKPSIKIETPTWDEVGWTVTDMNTKPELKERQFSMMAKIHRRAKNFHVIVQGGEVVLQEYIFCRDGVVVDKRVDKAISPTLYKSNREMKSLPKLAKTVAYYYRDAPEELVQTMIERSFFSNNVHDYMRYLRSLSFVCGTRLHGNMMALCQGKPVLYAVHDERLTDMTELMKVPSINLLTHNSEIDLEQFDWASFEAAYEDIYMSFVEFLDENNLAHNLFINNSSSDAQESVSPNEISYVRT